MTISSNSSDTSMGVKPSNVKENAVKDTVPPHPTSDNDIPALPTSPTTLLKALNDHEKWTKEIPINLSEGKTRLATFGFPELGTDNDNHGDRRNRIDGILQYLLKQFELDNEGARDRYEFELKNRKLQLQKEKEKHDIQEAHKQREHEPERLRMEIELETIRSTKKSPSPDATIPLAEKVSKQLQQ
ncbi:uncharacterized protein DFL_003489 [Arthrobotrys flagrans]|uniref:Uncharacterized protein n=1 Tax=Arthrobotrys flagrans TaxID=97331 RepID=A0A437A1Z9_ARTFL|nr:hypothetical protein DFL_003489 [Arthrobotrys flagrans]